MLNKYLLPVQTVYVKATVSVDFKVFVFELRLWLGQKGVQEVS